PGQDCLELAHQRCSRSEHIDTIGLKNASEAEVGPITSVPVLPASEPSSVASFVTPRAAPAWVRAARPEVPERGPRAPRRAPRYRDSPRRPRRGWRPAVG